MQTNGSAGFCPGWYRSYLVAKIIGGVTPYQIEQEPAIWIDRILTMYTVEKNIEDLRKNGMI